MKRIERIGVSLDKKLLSNFDKLIAKQGYQNRSEAIRDLLREQLSREQIRPATLSFTANHLLYAHPP